MGEEDVGHARPSGDHVLEVLVASAPDADAAARAAERLVALDGAKALCGGFGTDAALALSGIAAAHGIPFLNIGSPSDELRDERCGETTFHVEASAAMYLDALTESLARAGYRRWFVVTESGPRADRRVERFRRALHRPRLHAEEVGLSSIPPDGAGYAEALERIRTTEPDVVLMLFGWLDQLDFLGHYEASGLTPTVTGFPEPVAQTRSFYDASQDIAPRSGTGYRAALWEATARAHGAGELNDRFLARWGVPMDGPAWSAYASVQILAQTMAAGAARDGSDLVARLRHAASGFELHKGPGVSFRPWDGQLRQPLYLVEIEASGRTPRDRAHLVDTLPSSSGRDLDAAAELDRLGDLAGASSCGVP